MSHNISVKNIFYAKKELDQAFGVFTYITERLSKKKHNVDQCFAEERNLCSTKEVESYCEVFTEYMETHQQYCKRHEEFIKAINNYNEEREKMEWDSIDLSGFSDDLFPVLCANSNDRAFGMKTNGNGNSEKRDENTGQIINDRHMSIGSGGWNKKIIRMNTENNKDNGRGLNKNDTKTKSSFPRTGLNGDVNDNEESDEENEPIELPRSKGSKEYCRKDAYICRTQRENDNTDDREHCASSPETKRNLAPKSSVNKRKYCNKTIASADYEKDSNGSNAKGNCVSKQQEKKSRNGNGDKKGKKSDISVSCGVKLGSEMTGNQQEKSSSQLMGTKSSPIGILDSGDEEYGSKPNIISPRSRDGENVEGAICSQSTGTTTHGKGSWKKSYHSHSPESEDESSDEDFTRKSTEKTSIMSSERAKTKPVYMRRTEAVDETSSEGNIDEQKEKTSTLNPKQDLRPSTHSQRIQEIIGIIDEEHDADNESFAEEENSDDDNNKPKEKMLWSSPMASSERKLRMSTRVQRPSKYELRKPSRKNHPAQAEINETTPNERINFPTTNPNQCQNEGVSKRSNSIFLSHSYGRQRETLNIRLEEKFGIKIGQESIGFDHHKKKITHLLLTRKFDNLVKNKDDVLTFWLPEEPDGKENNFHIGELLSRNEKPIPIFYDPCYRGKYVYYVGHWHTIRHSSKIYSPPLENVCGKPRCMSIDFIYDSYDWKLEQAINL